MAQSVPISYERRVTVTFPHMLSALAGARKKLYNSVTKQVSQSQNAQSIDLRHAPAFVRCTAQLKVEYISFVPQSVHIQFTFKREKPA
jgi:hypothetical protein